MKRFLLLLLLFMFTSLSAQATYSVHFGNTGRPAFRSHGGGMYRSVNRFGSNAAFTPANRRYAGVRNRAIQRDKAITKAISSMGTRNYNINSGSGYGGSGSSSYYRAANIATVEPSRLSKNYTPAKTKKIYTKDGITYYN